MKNIKTIIVLVILCLSTISTTKAKEIESVNLNVQTTTIAEQVYNRLNVSSSIVVFTNDYIDSKKTENLGVAEIVWTNIKNNINYNLFKNSAIQVLNDNLTTAQMQELLDYFADRPSIPIPNLTVKKEIANTITSFNVHVDQVISSFL